MARPHRGGHLHGQGGTAPRYHVSRFKTRSPSPPVRNCCTRTINSVCACCSWPTIVKTTSGAAAEPHDAGLSRFGRAVVSVCNKLGVVVDCAHTGKRTTLDAVEASTAPVVVSHANAYGVHPSLRNVDDDVIRAVADSGGVIGLNCFPAFISSSPRPTVAELVVTPRTLPTWSGRSMWRWVWTTSTWPRPTAHRRRRARFTPLRWPTESGIRTSTRRRRGITPKGWKRFGGFRPW